MDYPCNQFKQLLNVSRVFTDVIQWVYVPCFLILLVDCAQNIVFQKIGILEGFLNGMVERKNCCFTGEVNMSANENGYWFMILGSLEG